MTFLIEKLDAAGLDANSDALADILHAAVQAGASVGFIWPFSREDARAFFAGKVRDGVAGGKTGAVCSLGRWSRGWHGAA